MNIHTGQLLGLGSSPSYDPSIFAKPRVPPVGLQGAGTDEDLGAPLFDRATNGFYPTGSTFKPITALAALDSGALGLSEIINDTGDFPLGDGQVLHNAGDAVNGPIELRQALKVSSDVFFYTLGYRMDRSNDTGDGGPIQQWARALGIGQPTGPRRRRRGRGPAADARLAQRALPQVPGPESPGGKDVVPNDFYKYGGLDRPWSVGDNVNLAVGQGDLQADPLQMAVAYAAIANGGDVVRPHVGLRVEDPQGRAIQEIDPAVRDHVDIDPAAQRTIMRRPARRRDGAGRDLLPGLRRLPDRHRRQDRHRGDAASGESTSPGTWRWRLTTTRSTSSR